MEKYISTTLTKDSSVAKKISEGVYSNKYILTVVYSSENYEIKQSFTIKNSYNVQKITLKYSGNTTYASSSNSSTFMVIKPTMIRYAYLGNVKLGSTVEVVGRLVDTVAAGAVKYVPVFIVVNSRVYNLNTDGAGYFRVNHTVNSYDVQKVSLKFAGNDLYVSCSNSTSFMVKKPTFMRVAYLGNVMYGSNVQVVGRLMLNDTKGFKYRPVSVDVNGKVYNVVTDGAGYFSINYTVNSYDVQKVSLRFAGSSLYVSCSNSSTFMVKKPTMIRYAYLGNVKLGSTVEVVGRLVDSVGGGAVKYVPVSVVVNSRVYKLSTDGAGYFRVNHTVNSYDVQKVSLKFAGNDLYIASSNSTSFMVKKPTFMRVAYLGNVKLGSNVQVVGRLMLNDTKGFKYRPVSVDVNGKVYNVVTDGAGYFSINYTVNNYNVQKVILKFAGSNLYVACSNSSTFMVKKPTMIRYAYLGNVKLGSTVEVVGRLVDSVGGGAVKYVPVSVVVNSRVYKLSTDGAGYFRVNHTVNSYDVQKVSLKFEGNDLYIASSNSTTFKVKQPTLIKHVSIGKIKIGTKIQFVGRILYNNSSPVKYVPITLKINNNIYELTTDGAGYFRINYTATIVGINNITSVFIGNELYLSNNGFSTFTVVKS